MNTTMINGFVVPKAITHIDGLEEVCTINPYEKDGWHCWYASGALMDKRVLMAVLNGAAYDSEEKVKAVVSAMRGIDPEWGE